MFLFSEADNNPCASLVVELRASPVYVPLELDAVVIVSINSHETREKSRCSKQLLITLIFRCWQTLIGLGRYECHSTTIALATRSLLPRFVRSLQTRPESTW